MIPVWNPPVSGVSGLYGWGGFAVATNLALPRLREVATPPDTWFRWRSDGTPLRSSPIRSTEITTRGAGMIRVEVCVGDVVRYGVEGVGLFEVRAGQRAIHFFPSPGADPMRVEHNLINAVLPIYAGLRSVVCLHAAATAIDSRATVFAGPPGSGKSTRALQAIASGSVLLGDDAVVLRKPGRAWFVLPGSRTVRLEESPGPESWLCGPKLEAFVPFADDPAPLRKIVVLDRAGARLVKAERPAVLFRALLSLQPAWGWGTTQARIELAALTADLCEQMNGP